MVNPNWSNRIWNMFVNANYATVEPFPEWVEILYKRYWSVYHRWYGL